MGSAAQSQIGPMIEAIVQQQGDSRNPVQNRNVQVQQEQSASVPVQQVNTNAIAQTPQGPQGPQSQVSAALAPEQIQAMLDAGRTVELEEIQRQQAFAAQQEQQQAVEQAQTRTSTGQAQEFDNVLLALQGVAQNGGLVGQSSQAAAQAPQGNPNLKSLLSP
jgi:hypothetical protein|tara:strand:+ start:77 stop:562 length:486 start_codon:yes stop_codon:yes gene_type:complete